MNYLLLALSLWVVDADTECVTKIQRVPEVRQGVSEEDILHSQVTFDAGQRKLKGVYVFSGTDRGDIVEMSTSVYANGIPVALTSIHKEVPTYYDAYRWFPNYDIFPGPVDEIAVHVDANVTGKNPYKKKRTARPHWGVWLIWECSANNGSRR